MLTPCFKSMETSRLLLRSIRLEDATQFYTGLGSSEAVTRHMLWKAHASPEESVQSIRKAIGRYETMESCRWAITRKDDGTLIGIIDLMPREESCTFAYMLAQDHWNRGYGTEALKAVLDFAFREWNAESVFADHFSENRASGIVMEKAGMKCTGILPAKYEKNGVQYDAPQYRITRQEWEEKL